MLLGVGNGSFHDPVSYPVSHGTTQLVVADLDRDGFPDIATNSIDTNAISVLEGNGDGTFQPQVNYPAGDKPNGVASGDFNGDGIPDLATADYLFGLVAILLGRPQEATARRPFTRSARVRLPS